MSDINHLPHYSYEDYCLWEGRWELIFGVPYAMTPAPGISHQRVSQKIGTQLEEALRDCEFCHALLPIDWKISEETVVQPDNLVICYRPDSDKFLTRAPSLILEILSPATAAKDRGLKFEIYEREGVKYYCIVDLDNRVAKIYKLSEGRYVKQLDACDETFDFDLGKCLLGFDFSGIWPDL